MLRLIMMGQNYEVILSGNEDASARAVVFCIMSRRWLSTPPNELSDLDMVVI